MEQMVAAVLLLANGTAAKKLQPATHVALIARSTTRFANTHSKTPSSLLSTLSLSTYICSFVSGLFAFISKSAL
jgi:hypothetical protein